MARTLDQGFETFLGWLAPLVSEHTKAKSHKDSVAASMKNNFECYSFFETGSFGNGTGVRHHSDTDYFAICKTASLNSDSGVTLRKIKEALQTTFPRTLGIEVKTPSVKIPFGIYASETLEVTPGKYIGMINTPVGNMPYYSIPDFDGDWMQSSPGAHNAYVEEQNSRLGGKLKPLIRLVKAWKFYNNVPITSFYLELRVTKYAERETSIVYDIDLWRIIKLLYNNQLASILDPMGISGYVPACASVAKRNDALSKLTTAYVRAEKANNTRNTNLDDCFYWWNMFYNSEFPSR